MKKFISKLFFALFFFSLGFGTAVFYYENTADSNNPFKKQPAKQINTVLNDIKQQTDKEDGFLQGMLSSFKNMFNRLGQNTPKDVVRKEDTQNVYYIFKINTAHTKNLKMKVDVSTVVLSGDKLDTESGAHQRYAKFYRSFPVPAGVDGKKAVLQHESDRVIIQFPKR
jgi:HSP20 family molecular chaperone IbpA